MPPEMHSPDWYAGAKAEHDSANEGLSKAALLARSALEAYARLNPELGSYDLAATLAWIYADETTLRGRLRLCWRLLRRNTV